MLKAVRVIEDKVKTLLLRRRFRRQSAAAVKIQAFWKAHFHQYVYNSLFAITIQLVVACGSRIVRTLSRRSKRSQEICELQIEKCASRK